MSNVRRQLEAWLKTIDVKGSVLDVGGLAMPIQGRTKSWDADNYKILDLKGGDYVFDMNKLVPDEASFDIENSFDIVFCLEVFEYIWNPYYALLNINGFLKQEGILYISTHFLFPHHHGTIDCLRYTRSGIEKLLQETGFGEIEITPRIAGDKIDLLLEWEHSESKVCKFPTEIGHLIKCKKI